MDLKEQAKKTYNTLSNLGLTIYLVVIFVVILVGFITYLNKQNGKKRTNYNNLSIKDLKTTGLTISPYSSELDNTTLKDYYIMGSYNSCCGGDNYNDFVDINVLKEVIGIGVRVIDLEIYSSNGNPIVAAGKRNLSVNESITKGTYNHLELNEVFKVIKTGFTNYAPNKTDPIILNLRMKTLNKGAYKRLAEKIENFFRKDDHLLVSKLGRMTEHRVENDVINEPISKLEKKLIISVYDPNDTYKEVKEFSRLVNMSNGTNTVYHTNFHIQNTTKRNINYKHKINIVLPDDTDKMNPPMIVHQKKGCQISLLNFGNDDANLRYCLAYFNKKGKAYVLKPEKLRHIPVPVKIPNDIDEEVLNAKTKIYDTSEILGGKTDPETKKLKKNMEDAKRQIKKEAETREKSRQKENEIRR